ncbi:MAG: hypothetical protein D6813_01750 [Calditrichaeota bacterium]|nr:MAG: hypothetical protein D6813_01750 [Calditrichota bacterium]
MRFMTLFLICSLWVGSVFAVEKNNAQKALTENHHRPSIKLATQNYLHNYQETKLQLHNSRKKSITKAVLLSAFIPGGGEFYLGSYLKSLLFVGVEAASIGGFVHFHNRGESLEAAFQRYADENWNPDDYWDWLSQISGIPRDDMDALREFERNNFSHFLPEQKNQQYYENIGKYDQFNVGWKDTNNGGARDSALREKYTLMRKDANDNFKRATTMATITLLNHVFSALDAAWTTTRHNKRIMSASLRFKYVPYNTEWIPALALGVTW